MAVPPSLKTVGPYIKQAQAVSSRAAFDINYAKIAYYCRVAAADEGMASLQRVPASEKAAATAFLTELLQRCEEDKAAYSITKDQEAADMQIVQRYALTLFKRADEADRALCATMETARQFTSAAEVMGVLRKLGYADAATQSKIKHAKSRAIEIAKAAKEGRQPAPPPGGDDSELLAGLEGLDWDAPSSGAAAAPAPAPITPATSVGALGGYGGAAAAAAGFDTGSLHGMPPPGAAYGGTGSGGGGGKDDDEIPMAYAVHPPPGAAAQSPYSTYYAAPAAAAPPPSSTGSELGGSSSDSSAHAAALAAMAARSGGSSAPAPAPAQPAPRALAASASAAAGSSRTVRGAASSGSGGSSAAVHDAKEFAKFALAALSAPDIDTELAAQHLRSALAALGR